jgi:hypothetical protein
MDPADYVLQAFEEEEQPLVAEAVERAVAAVEFWLAEDVAAAMDRFNRPASAQQEPITVQDHAGNDGARKLQAGNGGEESLS